MRVTRSPGPLSFASPWHWAPCVAVIALGCSSTPAQPDPDLTSLVDVFRGTREAAPDFGTGGGAGNTFPGPVLPFGAIKLGPDTLPATRNFGGGYAYDDFRIRGFSLTRFSGAGCWGYRDVPITPTVAGLTESPVNAQSINPSATHVSTFSHAEEEGEPGFYRVALNPGSDRQMDVALTATLRTGAMRVRFPSSAAASLLFNAGGSSTGVSSADVQIDPERREVTGTVHSGDFCFHPHRYTLHFVAQLDRTFDGFGTWQRQALFPGSTSNSDEALVLTGDEALIPGTSISHALGFGGDAIETAQTGAYVTFDTAEDRDVEVRVGISFVSLDNARANLAAESDPRSFEQIRQDARDAWNAALRTILVEGGTAEERRTFYTSLYHAQIQPSTFTDVNGEYMGMDGVVHTAAGRTQYADFSGWDIYRAQVPLLALIAPDRLSDMMQSMVATAEESGWLPKWPVANGHTGSMTGDPAPIMLATAHALGARGFDVDGALRAMVRGGTELGRSDNAGYIQRPAILDYLALGYVPHERNGNQITQALDANLRAGVEMDVEAILAQIEAFAGDDSPPLSEQPQPTGEDALALAWGSAATTVDYAAADFAIASLAGALGDTETCRDFLGRSANWRNVFDEDLGAMRPKWADGSWLSPFDPAHNDPFSSFGFPESNAVQTTWTVLHDVAGLVGALGGRDAATERLDDFFTELNAGFSAPHAFLGNQPSLYAPWLYHWTGRPDRAQAVLRRAIVELYDDTPGGYPGNDDLGTLSSWYMFAALGLYPLPLGQDVALLGSPLFPRATLRLPGGDLVIEAEGAHAGLPYVTGIAIDGTPHDRPWLRLSDLAAGGRIVFSLSDAPDPTWGRDPSDAPPSYAPGATSVCP